MNRLSVTKGVRIAQAIGTDQLLDKLYDLPSVDLSQHLDVFKEILHIYKSAHLPIEQRGLNENTL